MSALRLAVRCLLVAPLTLSAAWSVSGGTAAFAQVATAPAAPADTLASWAPSASRQAILDFVAAVADPGSDEFVPIENRIVTFDNDGTLWTEWPLYSQLLFAIDRIRELSVDHPEWQQQEPFASLLRGDLTAALSSEHAIGQLLVASHAGMTTDEFDQIVRDWIATAQHPHFQRPVRQCVYQPMLELIDLFQQHDFQVYIISGGGVEFMRPWASDVYGIPVNQIVGSSIKLKWDMRGTTPVLVRLPEVDFIDDGPGKPVGIFRSIGKRPIAAFGNSDGDLQMLQWVTAGEGRRLAAIVHHTDDQREAAYDRQSSVGRLNKALDLAPEHGWLLIDMQRDWTTVFPVTP